jgi:hypothetical protein
VMQVHFNVIISFWFKELPNEDSSVEANSTEIVESLS